VNANVNANANDNAKVKANVIDNDNANDSDSTNDNDYSTPALSLISDFTKYTFKSVFVVKLYNSSNKVP
jgi:hypothetical protein